MTDPRRIYLGSTPAERQGAADLAQIVERARIRSQGSTEAQAAGVLRILGNAGGFLHLDELVAQGAPREVLAALLDDETGDKRTRPRARVGFVEDAPVVWLTATGWQAVGRPSGREVVPDRMTVQEAAAPLLLRKWLRAMQPERFGASVHLATGKACRDFSAEVSARAWARLRFSADTDGALGSLTGGLLPDGLIVERWSGALAAANYANAWKVDLGQVERADLAETVTLLEVETTDKRERLRGKVERLTAVVEDLHLARAVVWVVSSVQVRDRLLDLGLGDERTSGVHYLVPAHALGLPGEPFPVPLRSWWPLLLPPCETRPGPDGSTSSPHLDDARPAD